MPKVQTASPPGLSRHPLPAHPRPRVLAWLAAWAVCTIVSLSAVYHPGTTPTDIDEVYWIGSAYYYHLALTQPNWSHPDWRLLPARENPPVAKYVIGAGLAATGHRISTIDLLATFYVLFEHVPNAWGQGSDYAKRAEVAARMSPDYRRSLPRSGPLPIDPAILLDARRTMLVCILLSCACIFALGALSIHPAAGFLASQLLLLHPIVGEALNHAMSEAVALLFTTAAALLLFLWMRRGAAAMAAAAGIMIGLACGAKMNSLILLPLAGILTLVSAARSWGSGARIRAAVTAAQGILIAAAAFTVFTVINPAILQDLRGGLIACFQEHRLTEAIQARFTAGHLTNPLDKLLAALRIAFFHPLIGLLFLAAAILCCRSRDTAAQFAGWWWIAAFLGVALWIPFPWSRYALPLIPPSTLVLASTAHILYVRAAH